MMAGKLRFRDLVRKTYQTNPSVIQNKGMTDTSGSDDLATVPSTSWDELLKQIVFLEGYFLRPSEKATTGTGEQTVTARQQLNYDRKKLTTVAEFAERTTFHGIRFIFRDSASTIRRLLWLIVVISVTTLFLYQVVQRSKYYFMYNFTTNVEVVYTDRVPFPQVTFCNHNQYRISEAVALNMYEFLDYVYSSSIENENEIRNVSFPETDSNTILARLAHQLEIFVDSCTWNGRSCDLYNAVKRVVTDAGVCYAFSPIQGNSTLHTFKAGSRFSLSLKLNIEQYEYMNGENDEAGIMMLLHDPLEPPLVADLGFAIPPGTHTLVGIDREEIWSLPKPFGDCVESTLSKNQCTISCRSQEMLKYCGCVDAYVLPRDDVCDIKRLTTCIRKLNGVHEGTMTDTNCTKSCQLPCRRVVYSPRLSYSHLSKLNEHSIWQEKPRRKEEVLKLYVHAREVYDRIHKSIYDADKSLMTNMIELGEKLHKHIDDSIKVIGDAEYLQNRTGIYCPPTVLSDSMLQSLSQIKDEYDRRQWMMLFRQPNMTYLGDHSDTIITRIMFQGLTPQPEGELLNFLNHCALLELNETSSLDTAIHVIPDTVCNEFDKDDNFLTFIRGQMDPDSTYKLFGYSLYNGISEIVIPSLQNLSDIYKADVAILFENTTHYEHYVQSSEYVQCIEVINQVAKPFANLYSRLESLFDSYLSTNSWVEKLSVANDIDGIMEATNEFLSDKDVFESCQWFRITIGDDQDWVKFLDGIANIPAILHDLEQVERLKHSGQLYLSTFLKIEDSVFNPLYSFINGKLNKSELHSLVSSERYSEYINKLMEVSNQHINILNALATKYQRASANLKDTLRAAYKSQVPVMVFSTVSKLDFLENVRYYYGNIPEIQQLYSESLSGFATFGKIIDETYGKYQEQLLHVVSDLQETISGLDKSYNKIKGMLSTFVEGSKIDTTFYKDNYIIVDVYYQELSFRRVKQQNAFEFVSLLSEVGGLLGLLSGASVLTVCELIDFIAVYFVKKFSARNEIGRRRAETQHIFDKI